ncbi:MAG: hypothetical protein K0S32_1817 [Bacteroidetes bacterium]|jgi:hypothetical protein|nr:hypothetical protein [Bacteroidota bacterium]
MSNKTREAAFIFTAHANEIKPPVVSVLFTVNFIQPDSC